MLKQSRPTKEEAVIIMIIDRKTFYAVAELVQAAAHQQGIVGPVEFHVCKPREFKAIAEDEFNNEKQMRLLPTAAQPPVVVALV